MSSDAEFDVDAEYAIFFKKTTFNSTFFLLSFTFFTFSYFLFIFFLLSFLLRKESFYFPFFWKESGSATPNG
jgi:hypothetical protein